MRISQTKKKVLGLYWGYTGKTEKQLETTIMGYIGFKVLEGPKQFRELGLCFGRAPSGSAAVYMWPPICREPQSTHPKSKP